ncbi:MAG: hypothetical protein NTZ05_16260 [Chloroflexi bacterium]|nr:hypothetical protein [Chloroflexota bacterium]
MHAPESDKSNDTQDRRVDPLTPYEPTDEQGGDGDPASPPGSVPPASAPTSAGQDQPNEHPDHPLNPQLRHYMKLCAVGDPRADAALAEVHPKLRQESETALLRNADNRYLDWDYLRLSVEDAQGMADVDLFGKRQGLGDGTNPFAFYLTVVTNKLRMIVSQDKTRHRIRYSGSAKDEAQDAGAQMDQIQAGKMAPPPDEDQSSGWIAGYLRSMSPADLSPYLNLLDEEEDVDPNLLPEVIHALIELEQRHPLHFKVIMLSTKLDDDAIARFLRITKVLVRQHRSRGKKALALAASVGVLLRKGYHFSRFEQDRYRDV